MAAPSIRYGVPEQSPLTPPSRPLSAGSGPPGVSGPPLTDNPPRPAPGAAPPRSLPQMPNGPRSDADWQRFYDDSNRFYNTATQNGANKALWTADVYSRFAQQYGISDAVARQAFADYNADWGGGEQPWQKNYTALQDINANPASWTPTGGWQKFYDDSNAWYHQQGFDQNRSGFTPDVYAKFAQQYGMPRNVARQAYAAYNQDWGGGELPWQDQYQKLATAPQVTAGKIADTPSYKINPINWDSLGSVGQALVQSAVKSNGDDWNTWLEQLNAARPQGTAPKIVNMRYPNSSQSVSSGASGVY